MIERERMGPPPVEPLSDAAWARVERGLWARVDDALPVEPSRGPRRWLWIAAPLAAAAALVIALGVRSGGPGHSLDAAQPARVVSGAAPTSLLFGDIHVSLDANSALVMNREARALLERGAAAFAVPRRASRPPFVVAAGDAIVRVIGTQFRVARSGEEIFVEVQHGFVEVQYRSVVVQVGAGQRWASQQPAAVEPIDDRSAVLAPQLQDRSARDAVIEIAPPAPVEPDKAGAAPPPPRPPARPKSAAVQADKPAPHPDSSESEFRRLEALEPHDPSAAVAGYLELAQGQGAWSAPALFAAARLSADRKEARAAALLQRYLQRYPRGANADDARKLLALLQRK